VTRDRRPPSDLVLGFTAFDSWDAAVNRQHAFSMDRLVQRAIEDPDVSRLLVVDPFRSAPILGVRRVLGSRPAFPTATDRRLVTPVRVRRRDPLSRSGLVRTYVAHDRAVERAARRMGLSSPVMITSNPFVAAYAPARWAGTVTYYAWDDWSGYPLHRSRWGAYEEAYEAIRSNGRGVCAVSRPLLERIGGTGPATVVPNGVDADLWRPEAQAPDWMAHLPRPVLLYSGSIDDRIDLAAMSAAATAVPRGTVLIVGQVVDPRAVEAVAALENVVVRPRVDHVVMPSIVAGCDVGLVPHRRTRLTESMSPLKAYEFLAGGLPVVGTDLVPMRGIDPRMVLVDSPEDFGDGVEAALALGRMPEAERVAFVDANSWTDRTSRVLDFAAGLHRA